MSNHNNFPQLTHHAEVNELITGARLSLRSVLGDKLLGLYLFGSAATGNFYEGVSDVDLFALLSSKINDQEFLQLDNMHTSLISNYPAWEGRFEIAYASEDALSKFPDESHSIAVLSPGEPFHIKELGLDWAINWHVLGQQGVTIYGSPAEEVFSFISNSDFIEVVRAQVIEWVDWLPHTKDSAKYQAYAVLTLCRALYVITKGKQPSKQVAGEWVRVKYPVWSDLISWAFKTRLESEDDVNDPSSSYPQVEKFITFVASETNPE